MPSAAYSGGTVSGGGSGTGSRHMALMPWKREPGPMSSAAICVSSGWLATSARAAVSVRSSSSLCQRPLSPVGPPRWSLPRSVQFSGRRARLAAKVSRSSPTSDTESAPGSVTTPAPSNSASSSASAAASSRPAGIRFTLCV